MWIPRAQLKKGIPLTSEAEKEAKKWIQEEIRSKGAGNISIDIRREKTDLNYLSMAYLPNLDDKKDLNKNACLARDAKEYKPMRDAIAHTALLTDLAKQKFNVDFAQSECNAIFEEAKKAKTDDARLKTYGRILEINPDRSEAVEKRKNLKIGQRQPARMS